MGGRTPDPVTPASLSPKVIETGGNISLGESRKEILRELLGSGGGKRYALGEELGRGGMGVVHLAADRDLRRAVAVKFMQERQSAGRFLREAQVTAQLEHPNIVPVHDIGLTSDESLFFTMKVVEGRPFSDLLRSAHEKGRGLRRDLEILLKACDALAFAHARGVVHRDLKPANLMIGAFGEVLVMDWGLAKVAGLDDETAGRPVQVQETDRSIDGAAIGTPSYMAPEQARGEAVDARTDVFALGAILHEILVGIPPITGADVNDLLRRAQEGRVTSPLDTFHRLQRRRPKRAARLKNRGVPPELSAVAAKAMAPKPGDRYPTVGEFQQDIRRFLEGRGVTAKRDPIPVQVIKWIRRNPVPSAAAAAAMVALLVGMTMAQAQAAAARRSEFSEKMNLARGSGPFEDRLAACWGALSLQPGDLVAQQLVQQITSDRREAERSRKREAALSAARKLQVEAASRVSSIPDLSGDSAPEERRTAIAALLEAENRLRESGALLAPYGGQGPGQRYAANRMLCQWALEAADTTLARVASSVCRTLDPGRAASDRLEQLITDAEEAVARDRAARIQEALDTLASGLSRTKREGGADTLEDLVFEIAAFRDEQTVRLLAAALVPMRERAETKGKEALWTQEDRDLLKFIFRVLGRLDVESAVAPLAEIVPLLWDTRLVVECGLALCNTRSPAAHAPLEEVALRFRFDTVWRQISGAFVRVPEPKGGAGPKTAEAFVRRGMLRLEQGDVAGARSDFESAIELDPDHAPAHMNLGNVKVEEGDLNGAIIDFNRAIEINPAAPKPYMNRGLAKSYAGDERGAIEDYTRAIERDPKDATALINRGESYRALGELQAAMDDYTQALKIEPRNPNALTARGAAKSARGDLKGAIEDLTRALMIHPEFAFGLVQRGKIYRLQGKTRLAIDDFSMAINFDRQFASAFINRGSARLEAGDAKGAIEDLTRGLDLDPNNLEGWVNRGSANMARRRWKAAIADLTKAIELKKAYLPAIINRGLAHAKRRDYLNAIRDFTRAIELAPNNVTAVQSRAAAKRDMGDADGAIEDFSRAIELQPTRAIFYYERGALLAKQKKLDKAIEDLTRSIERAPKYADAYFARGVARYGKGDARGAVNDLEEFLKLTPLDPRAGTVKALVKKLRAQLPPEEDF